MLVVGQFDRVGLCNAYTTRTQETITLLRNNMKQPFRLYRRQRGIYYIHDGHTGKQESLGTRDRAEASALFAAKTQAHRQAHLNFRLARTYLMAADPLAATRTWQMAMLELAGTKRGTWGERWHRAIKEHAFDSIRDLPIIDTQAAHFLKVLQAGRVSTNVYLRRIHNFVLDMNWLPCPLLPKRQWPAVRYQEKRAITHAEHLTILRREKSAERRAFCEMCWHLGGSQTDMANLKAEDVDWGDQVISFFRKKTRSVQIIHFGNEVVSGDIKVVLGTSGRCKGYKKNQNDKSFHKENSNIFFSIYQKSRPFSSLFAYFSGRCHDV